MEISGGSGQCDCKGWSRLNRVWNILPYHLLFFLGGVCLQLRGTVWSHGGALSALLTCALHRNHLHPLPPAAPPHTNSLSGVWDACHSCSKAAACLRDQPRLKVTNPLQHPLAAGL